MKDPKTTVAGVVGVLALAAKQIFPEAGPVFDAVGVLSVAFLGYFAKDK